jgi:type III pantothenate kinase
MTDYLHEKTALLPRIKITEPQNVIGKTTEQAMLAGAVFGYRGLVRELIHELKREMKAAHLPVVATGGYADLMAAGLPEISTVEPNLTLEGLRLVFQSRAESPKSTIHSPKS